MKRRLLAYSAIGMVIVLAGIASACATYALAPEPKKPLVAAVIPLPVVTEKSDLDTTEIKRLTRLIRSEIRAQKAAALK